MRKEKNKPKYMISVFFFSTWPIIHNRYGFHGQLSYLTPFKGGWGGGGGGGGGGGRGEGVEGLNTLCRFTASYLVIVYNRAIVNKQQIFLKVEVHVIFIDQCNQTARFTKSR